MWNVIVLEFPFGGYIEMAKTHGNPKMDYLLGHVMPQNFETS